jgi:hypothetical protein
MPSISVYSPHRLRHNSVPIFWTNTRSRGSLNPSPYIFTGSLYQCVARADGSPASGGVSGGPPPYDFRRIGTTFPTKEPSWQTRRAVGFPPGKDNGKVAAAITLLPYRVTALQHCKNVIYIEICISYIYIEFQGGKAVRR